MPTSRIRTVLSLGPLALASAGLVPVAHAQSIRALTYFGDLIAPGDVVVQLGSSGPAINNRGETVYGVLVTGPRSEPDFILVRETLATGERAIVVPPLSPTPFGPVLSFNFFTINDDGTFITESAVGGREFSTTGVFISTALPTLTPRAVQGVPLADGGIFDLISFSSLATTGGAFAISGFLGSEPFEEAEVVYGGTATSGPVRLAQQGAQVANLEGITFGNAGPININARGDIIFNLILAGDVDLLADDSAIVRADAAGVRPLEVLFRAGVPVPGVPGQTVALVTNPTTNNAGEVLLTSVSIPTGANIFDPFTPLASQLIRVTPGGETSLVLASGTPAPGFGPGRVIAGFSSGALNAHGDIALFTELNALEENPLGFERALYRISGGVLALAARQGSVVSNLGPNFVIDGFFGERPRFNAAGQIFFNAAVRDTATNRILDAIIAIDSDDTVVALAYTGQSIEVAPGDVRQIGLIEGVGSGGGEEGFRNFTNDLGQVTFSVAFTDNSGGYLFASLDPRGPCAPADFAEGFGVLDINDILAFANAFNASQPAADFFPDSIFDINDVLAFAAAFNAGCP